MMKIQNIGNRRIRLDKNLYLGPNQIIEVSYSVGKWAVRKHADIVNITPKRPKRPAPRPILRPKSTYKIKSNLEVKEHDIR